MLARSDQVHDLAQQAQQAQQPRPQAGGGGNAMLRATEQLRMGAPPSAVRPPARGRESGLHAARGASRKRPDGIARMTTTSSEIQVSPVSQATTSKSA